ncbi:hypothetical protein IQ243_25815 [Nostocales cyanobacterium LEGE 11386]|nr:hypothetical protein [Nostocales cyanobacterium LEGE 11386]
MQLLELELKEINSSFNDNSKPREWDEIDLSTPESRKERMEVLICQKAQKGEDITQCLQVLDYLKRRTGENKLYDILAQQAKERSVFNSLQRVCITSFAILGMIAFCHGVLTRENQQQPSVSNGSIEHNQFVQEGDKPDGIANAYRTERSAGRYRTDNEYNGRIQGQIKSNQ